MLFFQPVLALLIFLGVISAHQKKPIPTSRRYFFYFGAGIVLFSDLSIGVPLHITTQILPMVYDPVLYRIEDILNFDRAAIWMVHLTNSNLVILVYLHIVYNFLAIVIILGAASEMVYADAQRYPRLIWHFSASAGIGFGLYFLMPAVDPISFFGASFPDHLPNALALPAHVIRVPGAAVNVPRNTVPSLHATWAMLTFLALRRSPVWHRVLGATFVLSTLLATIGSGLHYLVDWVVALPLVALVRALGLQAGPQANGLRIRAILWNATLLGAWVLVLRGSPATLEHIAPVQGLALLSMAVPIWLEIRFEMAEDGFGQHLITRHGVPRLIVNAEPLKETEVIEFPVVITRL